MIDKKIRVDEIANEANVSPSTVSRVLNHPDVVSESTLEKVKSAMVRLGLDDSLFEKRSKKGEVDSKIILVIIPELSNPFFDAVIKGINSCAHAKGYDILIYANGINNDNIHFVLKMINTANVVGIISTLYLKKEILESICSKVPTVMMTEVDYETPVTNIYFDNKGAAKDATKYLISSGRKKIAFIGGGYKNLYSTLRLSGFLEAMEEANIYVPASNLIDIPKLDYDYAYSALTALYSSPNRPDAVFAVSDIIGIAAINAAKNSGLKVPLDVAVIGFDNVYFSTMSRPALTTISVPCHQMGLNACEMLIDKINNPSQTHYRNILNTELIIRGSV